MLIQIMLYSRSKGQLSLNKFIMGGHIDSWDTGSQIGVNDDGGGFLSFLKL